MLNRIYESNKALHDRFDLPVPKPTAARRRFLEEVGELLEASALSEPVYISSGMNVIQAPERMLEEAADVFYTVIGLLRSHNFTVFDFEDAVEQICASNDAKTTETHTIVKGKIMRKDV